MEKGGFITKQKRNVPIKLNGTEARVNELTALFRDLLEIVKRNVNAEGEDSTEKQRLVVNASKELRAILTDIAAETGGRGADFEFGTPARLDLSPLSALELAGLIGLEIGEEVSQPAKPDTKESEGT